MATYQDLIRNGQEITNQSTGRVYPNPEALAGDLGIAPHQIDWSQITAGGATPTTNPITSFNTALMGKLKSYQGLSSADLIKRQSAILKKLYKQQAAITPEEQRVLSPSQQSAIRGGQASALRPELEATKGQILDRKEARSRFLEMVGVAQDMSQQLEDVRGQQKDTALQALEIRAQAGDAMTPQEINDLVNLTGWDSQTIQSYYQIANDRAMADKRLNDLKIANEQRKLIPEPEPEPDITPTGEPDIFTQTQLNKGAIMAGLSVEEFNQLSNNDKNIFINNSDLIKSRKKAIDEAKANGEDVFAIQGEILESNMPNEVKKALMRYLGIIFNV